VPALPTFHALDLAPVLKLAAAWAMVAVMMGTIVGPQNQLLSEAGAALCGTRARVLRRAVA
jgi:hypothetical protein